MSMLIHGIKMPEKKNGAVLIIYPDGKCVLEDGTEYTASHVRTPHGRLIDADRMLADNEHYYDILGRPVGEIGANYRAVKRLIGLAPTIIEAEK